MEEEEQVLAMLDEENSFTYGFVNNGEWWVVKLLAAERSKGVTVINYFMLHGKLINAMDFVSL